MRLSQHHQYHRFHFFMSNSTFLLPIIVRFPVPFDFQYRSISSTVPFTSTLSIPMVYFIPIVYFQFQSFTISSQFRFVIVCRTDCVNSNCAASNCVNSNCADSNCVMNSGLVPIPCRRLKSFNRNSPFR